MDPLFSLVDVLVFTFCHSVFLQDAGAGLLAAAMIAVVPGYISRSVAGSYDNEGKKICPLRFPVEFHEVQ